MSNQQPEFIPLPKPVQEQDESRGSNPYDGRDHQRTQGVTGDSKLGVASLLNHLAGSLNAIDKQNVGGSTNLKAKKFDTKQTYSQIMGENVNHVQPVQPPVPAQPPVPVSTPPQQPVVQTQHVDTSQLEERVAKLEKIVSQLNIPLKFKRGISYNITTSKIKGTFSDPATIIEILSTELAKQTKSITLKLNDSSKS